MITLTVEDRSGSTKTLEVAPSGTLMEAIRDNDIETDFALSVDAVPVRPVT